MYNGLIKLHVALQGRDDGGKVSTAVVCLGMCLVQRLGELEIEPATIVKERTNLYFKFAATMSRELSVKINHDGFVTCSICVDAVNKTIKDTKDLCSVIETIQAFLENKEPGHAKN